jgi:hypothetical protein
MFDLHDGTRTVTGATATLLTGVAGTPLTAAKQQQMDKYLWSQKCCEGGP